MLQIDLLPFQLKLKYNTIHGKKHIYDPFRDKWLIATPEELVRQMIALYLRDKHHYPAKLIRLEKQIKVLKRNQRCDILIFNSYGDPMIMVECKNPEVELTNETLWQITRYNLPLNVPFLLITNGKKSYFMQLNDRGDDWDESDVIPDFPDADKASRQRLE